MSAVEFLRLRVDEDEIWTLTVRRTLVYPDAGARRTCHLRDEELEALFTELTGQALDEAEFWAPPHQQPPPEPRAPFAVTARHAQDYARLAGTRNDMAQATTIEWTEATWNPVTGCDRVSPGCAHCYALNFAERWRGVPGHPYEQGFDLRLWPQRLEQPLRWRRPRVIFVNSMSDLFHERIPDDYVANVFDVMAKAPQHTFQVLTKRPDRMAALAQTLPWPENVWLGVTIENRRFVDRADLLRTSPAAVRFISAEPLLTPLTDLELGGIDWLIAGGESGHRHRPIDIEWVRDLRDRCLREGVAFFFKQWGGRTSKAGGRLLDGREWDQMPRLGQAA